MDCNFVLYHLEILKNFLGYNRMFLQILIRNFSAKFVLVCQIYASIFFQARHCSSNLCQRSPSDRKQGRIDCISQQTCRIQYYLPSIYGRDTKEMIIWWEYSPSPRESVDCDPLTNDELHEYEEAVAGKWHRVPSQKLLCCGFPTFTRFTTHTTKVQTQFNDN